MAVADRPNPRSNFPWTACASADPVDGDDGGAGETTAVLAIGKFPMNFFLWNDLFARGFDNRTMSWEGLVANYSTRMGASREDIDHFLKTMRRNRREYDEASRGRRSSQYTLTLQQFLRALIYVLMKDVEKTLGEIYGKVPTFSPSNEHDDGNVTLSISRLFDTSPSAEDYRNVSPHGSGYDAMHIRRGDRIYQPQYMKVTEEYWVRRGYPSVDPNNDGGMSSEKRMKRISALYPTNYVPFSEYCRRYNSLSKCRKSDSIEIAADNASSDGASPFNNTSASNQRTKRLVYVATDDVRTIRSEIRNLTSSKGVEYRIHCDEWVEFAFNPRSGYAKHIHRSKQVDDQSGTEKETARGEEHGRYMRTIYGLTDLHILSQRVEYILEQFNAYI